MDGTIDTVFRGVTKAVDTAQQQAIRERNAQIEAENERRRRFESDRNFALGVGNLLVSMQNATGKVDKQANDADMYLQGLQDMGYTPKDIADFIYSEGNPTQSKLAGKFSYADVMTKIAGTSNPFFSELVKSSHKASTDPDARAAFGLGAVDINVRDAVARSLEDPATLMALEDSMAQLESAEDRMALVNEYKYAVGLHAHTKPGREAIARMDQMSRYMGFRFDASFLDYNMAMENAIGAASQLPKDSPQRQDIIVEMRARLNDLDRNATAYGLSGTDVWKTQYERLRQDIMDLEHGRKQHEPTKDRGINLEGMQRATERTVENYMGMRQVTSNWADYPTDTGETMSRRMELMFGLPEGYFTKPYKKDSQGNDLYRGGMEFVHEIMSGLSTEFVDASDQANALVLGGVIKEDEKDEVAMFIERGVRMPQLSKEVRDATTNSAKRASDIIKDPLFLGVDGVVDALNQQGVAEAFVGIFDAYNTDRDEKRYARNSMDVLEEAASLVVSTSDTEDNRIVSDLGKVQAILKLVQPPLYSNYSTEDARRALAYRAMIEANGDPSESMRIFDQLLDLHSVSHPSGSINGYFKQKIFPNLVKRRNR